MPPVPDESTGTLVAALLRDAPPATTAAALVALASLWEERARPLLLGALGVPDNVVRLAALSGLRAQHAIDGVVLRQFEPILSGTIPASDELRVAAAAAIADVRPETRPDAASALARALTRATSRTGPPTSAPVAVALAKALLAIGGPSAAAMVQERAASASDVVGRQLQSLLRG
jgi:hypothetical protein